VCPFSQYGSLTRFVSVFVDTRNRGLGSVDGQTNRQTVNYYCYCY